MEARAWRARPRRDANSNRRGWFPAPTGVAGIHAGDRGVPVGGRSVRSLAGRPLPAGGSDRLGRHLRVHCRSAPRWPSSWRVSAGTGAAAGIPGRCPCSARGSPSARDVVGELVDSYCEWLLRERGLAATTVRRYQATARRFLAQRAGGVDLNDLTAARSAAFLLAPAGMTPASRRGCRLTEPGHSAGQLRPGRPRSGSGTIRHHGRPPGAGHRSGGVRVTVIAATLQSPTQPIKSTWPHSLHGCPALVASPVLLRDELGCARRPPPASVRYRL